MVNHDGSTLAMAGSQPKSSSPPGAFPETPANEEEQTFSVNPIPASQGTGNPIQLAPGEKVPDPSTINTNTVDSTVHDDPELKSQGEQTVSVAPIPATGGIGNPIQLAPGEKVPDPSTFTSNTVESTVKTDQASYEKSDASAPTGTTQNEATSSDAMPTGPGPMIPESSMPMGNTSNISTADMGPTISSVGAGSTTNQLAGEVPKEPRGVPEVVSESQQEANVDPEASANPEAVEEKKAVEEELQKKVPEEPSTSDSGMLGKSENGIGAKVAAGAAAGGVAVAGAAVAANELIKDKTGTDPKAALPESVQKTVDDSAKDSNIPQQATTTSTTDDARETTTSVPEEVKASQVEAGQEPEASAVPEVVQEKAAMEDELLKKVPESEAQGEPAPTASAAATETAPAATTSSTGAPQLGDPTAGVAPISMDENAKPSEQHREVSPMSKPTEPTVTSGVASAPIPRNNGESASTPAKRQSFVERLKSTPESSKTSETTDSKKEKRRSFFGRLKDKLK